MHSAEDEELLPEDTGESVSLKEAGVEGVILQPLVGPQIIQPTVTKSPIFIPPTNQTNIILLYGKHKMLSPRLNLTISLQNLHVYLRTGVLRRQVHLYLIHIVQILHFLTILIGSTEHEHFPVLDAHGCTDSVLQ